MMINFSLCISACIQAFLISASFFLIAKGVVAIRREGRDTERK